MNKSVSSPIEKSVEESLSLLAKKTPRIILGVSGGPDSMALLYAFFKAKSDVIVVHINYGLRGGESDLDQELVEGMSVEWGFECCSVRLSSDDKKGNFQNWAREERYRIFEEMKEMNQGECIATAHHEDDQVESILQKVLRGSGVEAWQGMEVWDGKLLRPLLSHSKQEILDYCESNAIPYRIDESNLVSEYARNLIRNELADKFTQLFPGWRQNILSLSEKGKLTELAIQELLNSILEEGRLKLVEYSKLNSLLKPAVLKQFISSVEPSITVSKGLLEELTVIEKSQTGTTIHLSEKYTLVRDRTHITLKKEGDSEFEPVEISALDVNNGLDWAGMNISITNTLGDKSSLYIDATKVQWPLVLRRWEAGDKIKPLGMEGFQKISDHLTNRKIHSSKKEKALILSGVDGTIYAIIFPTIAANGEIGTISETIKCTEQTKAYLTLTPK